MKQSSAAAACNQIDMNQGSYWKFLYSFQILTLWRCMKSGMNTDNFCSCIRLGRDQQCQPLNDTID